MSTITFDTLKFAERLKKAGVPDDQAIAIVEAQKEALSEALDSTLATKSDIVEIKAGVAEVKAEISLVKWMMGALIALAAANFARQFF